MFNYSINCYNPIKNGTMLSTQFCVLSKGLNSGKPLLNPCPNCFILTAANEQEKEFLFWLCWGLWQSKKFQFFLTGSVIPFIRLNEFKSFLNQQIAIACNHQHQYQKSIKTLQQLQTLENNYKQNLQLIQKAKKMVFHSLVIYHKKNCHHLWWQLCTSNNNSNPQLLFIIKTQILELITHNSKL